MKQKSRVHKRGQAKPGERLSKSARKWRAQQLAQELISRALIQVTEESASGDAEESAEE